MKKFLSAFLSGLIILQGGSFAVNPKPVYDENSNGFIRINYLPGNEKSIYIPSDEITEFVEILKKRRNKIQKYKKCTVGGKGTVAISIAATIASAAVTGIPSYILGKKVLNKQDWSTTKKATAVSALAALAAETTVLTPVFTALWGIPAYNDSIHKRTSSGVEYGIDSVTVHTRAIRRAHARNSDAWPEELNVPSNVSRDPYIYRHLDGLIEALESIHPDPNPQDQGSFFESPDHIVYYRPVYTDCREGIILSLTPTTFGGAWDIFIYKQGQCIWNAEANPPVVSNRALILEGLPPLPPYREAPVSTDWLKMDENLIDKILA